MYINYVNDRKQLGYEVVKDTNCDIELLLIRNLPLNVKRKSKKIIIVSILISTLWFNNVQPSSAIGLSMGSAPVVRVQPSY